MLIHICYKQLLYLWGVQFKINVYILYMLSYMLYLYHYVYIYQLTGYCYIYSHINYLLINTYTTEYILYYCSTHL